MNAPTRTGSATEVLVSTSSMQTTYANLVRGLMTAEEIVLDFGFNPNSGGHVVDEAAEIKSRIILNVPSAVRLHQLLHALLARRQEAAEQAVQRSRGDKPGAAAAPAE